MGQKYVMDNRTVVILTKYCEGDKKENRKGDRCYQTLKINFKKEIWKIYEKMDRQTRLQACAEK